MFAPFILVSEQSSLHISFRLILIPGLILCDVTTPEPDILYFNPIMLNITIASLTESTSQIGHKIFIYISNFIINEPNIFCIINTFVIVVPQVGCNELLHRNFIFVITFRLLIFFQIDFKNSSVIFLKTGAATLPPYFSTCGASTGSNKQISDRQQERIRQKKYCNFASNNFHLLIFVMYRFYHQLKSYRFLRENLFPLQRHHEENL